MYAFIHPLIPQIFTEHLSTGEMAVDKTEMLLPTWAQILVGEEIKLIENMKKC